MAEAIQPNCDVKMGGSLTRSRKANLIDYWPIVGGVVSLLCIGAVMQYQVVDLRDDVKQLQADRKADHDLLIRVETNVSWIRKSLEDRKSTVFSMPHFDIPDQVSK